MESGVNLNVLIVNTDIKPHKKLWFGCFHISKQCFCFVELCWWSVCNRPTDMNTTHWLFSTAQVASIRDKLTPDFVDDQVHFPIGTLTQLPDDLIVLADV